MILKILVFLAIQRKAFNITSNQYLLPLRCSNFILHSIFHGEQGVTNILCFVYTYIYAQQRCIYLVKNTVQTVILCNSILILNNSILI